MVGFIYYSAAVAARAGTRDRVRAEPPIAADSEAFLRSVTSVTTNPIVPGNEVDIYQNGDQIFPAMLGAVAEARETVHFETFIYWSGQIAVEFARTFADAARRGVQVRVVLDWFGSQKMDRDLVAMMRDAGCEVRLFRAPEWHLLTMINRRTHRRLLIVDGRIGFTGGVGIADEWTGNAQDDKHWRDIHARFRGPMVNFLQGAFVDNWTESGGELLIGDRFFPRIERCGSRAMSVMRSNPSGGSSEARRYILASIQAAQRSVYITEAYFVPTGGSVTELCEAARRGADVRVLIPGEHIDYKTVRCASRHTWGDLIAGGVRVYEYQPTMIHAKTMIVDDCLFTVGSVNFDPRSFSLNEECTVAIADQEIALRMRDVFFDDLERAHEISMDEWRSRPRWLRLVDWFCFQLRGHL